MSKLHNFSLVACLLVAAALRASAQSALTWEQVRQRFEQNNPTLLADKLNVDESRAQEITAFLRPNPALSLRNQGEKLRTQLDIDRRQRLLDATQAQVLSDADSAYAALDSNLILLRPYKAKYLQQSEAVRDTITFAYQHGGASLLDFLNAENDYRTVQLAYVNLVGSYLSAASQLSLAVGREVLP